MSTYTRGREPIILGGDFNCIMEDQDRLVNSPFYSCFVGRNELESLLSFSNLIDSWRVSYPTQAGVTWKNPGQVQSSRLDRIYIPKDMAFADSCCIPCIYSDHKAIGVSIVIPCAPNKGQGFWKCNVSILKDIDFCKEGEFYYALWGNLKS